MQRPSRWFIPTDKSRALEIAVSLPPLVEPAADLSVDEVKRYSRHLIIPEIGVLLDTQADAQADAQAAASAVTRAREFPLTHAG